MFNRKFILWVGIAAILILTLIFLQTLIKRGVQGRLKSANDAIGNQFSTGNTSVQYEPYYLTTNYTVQRNSSEQGFQQYARGAIPVVRKLIKKAELNYIVEDSRLAAYEITVLVKLLTGISIETNVSQHANGSRD